MCCRLMTACSEVPGATGLTRGWGGGVVGVGAASGEGHRTAGSFTVAGDSTPHKKVESLFEPQPV